LGAAAVFFGAALVLGAAFEALTGGAKSELAPSSKLDSASDMAAKRCRQSPVGRVESERRKDAKKRRLQKNLRG
jgi:hypothetical protein